MSDETQVCGSNVQESDTSRSNATEHSHENRMHSFAMAAGQILVAFLLGLSAASPVATAKITLTICMLVLLTFLAFWPLHGNMIDRAIALFAGLASTWYATFALKRWLPQSVIMDNDTVSMSKFIAAIHPYERWAVSFALILVAATFVTFIRQMLRENRTNLVRNLSHTLTASIACAALPGWLFLPSIIRFMPSLRSLESGLLVAIFCIFMMILLAGLSYLWAKNNRSKFSANSITRDISLALLPIMLSGMLVYIAGLGMLVAA